LAKKVRFTEKVLDFIAKSALRWRQSRDVDNRGNYGLKLRCLTGAGCASATWFVTAQEYAYGNLQPGLL
jgi:hypothetical protein